MCAPATFWYHVFSVKPKRSENFAKNLYAQGVAMLGKLQISPSDALRKMDYATKVKGMDPPLLQTDWMLMCLLRDSENYMLAYGGGNGAIEEATSGGTLPNLQASWYRDTGFFSEVKLESYFVMDPTPTELCALKRTDTNAMGLYIKAKLISNEP